MTDQEKLNNLRDAVLDVRKQLTEMMDTVGVMVTWFTVVKLLQTCPILCEAALYSEKGVRSYEVMKLADTPKLTSILIHNTLIVLHTEQFNNVCRAIDKASVAAQVLASGRPSWQICGVIEPVKIRGLSKAS